MCILLSVMSLTITNIKSSGGKINKKTGLTDTADPYVYFKVWLGDGMLAGSVTAQTSEKNNDMEPNWEGEEIVIEGLGDTPAALKMEVTVYDSDFGRDDVIHSFPLDLGTLQQEGGHIQENIVAHWIEEDVFLEF